MQPNVGGFDRVARLGLGLVFLSVASIVSVTETANERAGVLTVIAVLAGVSLLVSALTRRCLGNRLLGIDTCKR